MHDAVTELGEFAGVPSVGCAHKVTGDALYCLELSTAFGTFLHLHVGIFVAAFRAMVAIVVDGAVAHVVFVHHIHYLHDALFVVGGVAVYLYIEDVSATGHLMVGCLDLSLVAG